MRNGFFKQMKFQVSYLKNFEYKSIAQCAALCASMAPSQQHNYNSSVIFMRFYILHMLHVITCAIYSTDAVAVWLGCSEAFTATVYLIQQQISITYNFIAGYILHALSVIICMTYNVCIM